MKFSNESTALYPVLRYYVKDAAEVGAIINRSDNYVKQRMSRNSGKFFTQIEKNLILRAINDLEFCDYNLQILFSERFNPEEKNKLLKVQHNHQLTISEVSA